MNSAKTLEDFKKILKTYEIETFSKFNVLQNPKGFLDENRKISADMKLHWKDGLPYFHFGSRIYTCHQGKDKNLGKKHKYNEKKQEKVKSDHILTQTTKKLDCPVSIIITRAYTLPQFKLENPTKSKKNSVSAKIKSILRNNEDFESEQVFWFTLPSVDAHKNHMQGKVSKITKPVDPVVRLKIKEFVHKGNSLSNPLFCGDKELFDNSYNADLDTIDIDHVSDDHDLISQVQYYQGEEVYGQLERKRSEKTKLIDKCNSHMRNLDSLLGMLSENKLVELEEDLLKLTKKIYESTGLPLEMNECMRNCSSVPIDKVKGDNSKTSVNATRSIKNKYVKLKAHSKRGFSGKIGMQVSAIKQSHKPIVIEIRKRKCSNSDIYDTFP